MRPVCSTEATSKILRYTRLGSVTRCKIDQNGVILEHRNQHTCSMRVQSTTNHTLFTKRVELSTGLSLFLWDYKIIRIERITNPSQR